MRFVRCEACGAKALIAASQCPRCTHPLELRDARGEAVPLAHCHKCETYYPRSRGGCKWCGTTASSTSLSPIPVIGGIAAAVLLVGFGLWQFRGRTSGDGDEQGRANAVVAVRDEGVELEEPPTPDAVIDTSALVALPSRPPLDSGVPDPGARPTVPSSTTTAAAMAAVPPVAAMPRPAVPPQVPSTGGLVSSASAAQVTTSPSGPYAGPWTRAVAVEWVNVRSDASREAPVVGVLTPDTRVLIGEIRAGWRRVRAAGLEGWADGRFFGADSTRR